MGGRIDLDSAVGVGVPGVVYVAEAGQHGRWHFVSAKITELLGYSPEDQLFIKQARSNPGRGD